MAVFPLLVLTVAQAVTPEDVLAESDTYADLQGVRIRKGTVGATLQNVKSINELVAADPQIEQNDPQLQQLLTDQRALIPSLVALGLFDLFSPAEWVNPVQEEGRLWIGVLMLQAHPERMSENAMQLLEASRNQVSPALKSEIGKLLGK